MNPQGPAGAHAHLRVNDLTKTIGNGISLGPFNLEVAPQEIVSIIGPAGCGKTTFLKMLAGLIPVTGGEIYFTGKKVDGPRSDIGFTFQKPVLLEWRTALENIMLQAELRGLAKQESRERARHLLISMGLGGFENLRPLELSAEMRRRVSICQAVLHDPPLLLLDEPFGALDSLTRERITLDLQRLWMARHRTVVIATQCLGEAVQLSDRVFVLAARTGEVAHSFSIDLPRPRRMDKATTPVIAEYCNRIRMVLQAHGALPRG